MDEKQQESEPIDQPQALAKIDLEALIAVVEARIVENLAQMIERLAGARGS
ncbi:MAG: hypothetical protein ABI700_26120 [Chloroflexota bacterium]